MWEREQLLSSPLEMIPAQRCWQKELYSPWRDPRGAQAEARFETRLFEMHLVLSWLVEHCTGFRCTAVVGAHGKAACERVLGRKCHLRDSHIYEQSGWRARFKIQS